MGEEQEKVRLDRWLWATRIYKTRSLAADACRKGQVKIAGRIVKPSSTLRPGVEIEVRRPPLTSTFCVLAVLEKRVGAKLVSDYLEDLTPQEELDKAASIRKENRLNHVFDAPGQGRPTRRQLDAMRRFREAADGSDSGP